RVRILPIAPDRRDADRMGKLATLVAALALGACTAPTDTQLDDACRSLCDCVAGLPSQRDACFDQCIAVITVPDAECQACFDAPIGCASELACYQRACLVPPTPQESP